jgi:saccharopine dehydrogenase-like NADP-dependent oxidoreductase
MRYCILGAGMQGAVAASMLARDPERPHVLLCDVDFERARHVAAHIGCERVEAATVDATDAASLVAAMRDCDMVLDLVFFELAGGVRRAALEAGCHYVNSAADSRFLEAIAFEHVVPDDEAFRAAGLCAVACCGWAPGVTNVLARSVADKLDEVEGLQLRIGFDKALWADPSEIAHPFRPHASPEVVLGDFGDKSLHFTGGKPIEVPPFALTESFDFGGAIGKLCITSHCHDEPYTLPVLVGKALRECAFRYPVNDRAATLVAMGMGDPRRVVSLPDGSTVKPFDVVMALVERPADHTVLGETREGVARARDTDRAVVVEASGRKDGQARRIRLNWYVHDGAELRTRLFEAFGSAQIWVALPMIVAAGMILRGELPRGSSCPNSSIPDASSTTSQHWGTRSSSRWRRSQRRLARGAPKPRGDLAESPVTGVTNSPMDASHRVGGANGRSAPALAAGSGALATRSDTAARRDDRSRS